MHRRPREAYLAHTGDAIRSLIPGPSILAGTRLELRELLPLNGPGISIQRRRRKERGVTLDTTH